MRLILLLGLFLSLLLGGCSSFPRNKADTFIDRDGVDVVSTQADRLSTYFKDRTTVERYCRGPGPDMSITASEGVTIGVPLAPQETETAKEGKTRGALDLGGRNPAVLITRELMYRACELSLNISADKKATLAIYERFLKAIVAISAKQTGPGVQALADEPRSPTADIIQPSGDTDDTDSGDSQDGGDGSGADSPPMPTPN